MDKSIVRARVLAIAIPLRSMVIGKAISMLGIAKILVMMIPTARGTAIAIPQRQSVIELALKIRL